MIFKDHSIKYNILSFLIFILGLTLLSINAQRSSKDQNLLIFVGVFTFLGIIMMITFLGFAIYELFYKNEEKKENSMVEHYDSIDFENPSFSDTFYNNNDSYVFVDYE